MYTKVSVIREINGVRETKERLKMILTKFAFIVLHFMCPHCICSPVKALV